MRSHGYLRRLLGRGTVAGMLPVLALMAAGVEASRPMPPKIGPEILVKKAHKETAATKSEAERIEYLIARHANPFKLDRHDCALYVNAPLTKEQIRDFDAQGIVINESVYIPPVEGKHPFGFYLATVPYDRLNVVAASPLVVMLRSTEYFNEAHDNLARERTNVDDVHLGTGLSQPYTGTGVTVAIADSSFDLTHPDFNGMNLVESYDMTDGADTMTWGTDVQSFVSDHGTHVAGSVVGTGGLSAGNYAGGAPNASFALYKIGGDSSSSASATDMIEAIARAAAIGADVFSMSYGGNRFHPDGSQATEQAVDAAVAAGTTCFISAGNNQSLQLHFSTTVAPNTTSPTFQVTHQNTNGFVEAGFVYFWVSWIDETPGDANIVMDVTGLGVNESFSESFSSFSVRGTEAKEYAFEIEVPASTSNIYDFTLQNTALSGDTPTVHVYSLFSRTRFNTPDPAYTIGGPAMADDAIAVASWSSRLSWTTFTGSNQMDNDDTLDTLANYSSLGPRIDGHQKPDVAAPGNWIISLRDANINPASSRIIDNDGLNLDGSGPAQYRINTGTSMACPTAAGGSLLVVEAWNAQANYPALTPAILRQLLQSTAEQAMSPDFDAGYGMLNILAAIQMVEAGPEADLFEDMTAIADGGGPVDFGTVAPEDADPTKTFRLENNSPIPMAVVSVVLPVGYQLTEGLDAVIPAGGSDEFTVTFIAATDGTYAGDAIITTGDKDEGSYEFGLTGSVLTGSNVDDWDMFVVN